MTLLMLGFAFVCVFTVGVFVGATWWEVRMARERRARWRANPVGNWPPLPYPLPPHPPPPERIQ